MGCFNVCCSISNLSINAGDRIRFIPLKAKKNPNLNCSLLIYQDCFFNPLTLPITGTYNDYGGIENIERDDNVLAIENYYGEPIDDWLRKITSSVDSSELAGMFVLEEVYNALVHYGLEGKHLYNSHVLEESLSYFGFKEVSKEEQFFIHPHYRKLFRNKIYGYDLFLQDSGATIVPTSEKQYVVVNHRRLNEIQSHWSELTKEDASTYPVATDSGLSKEEEFEIVSHYLKERFGYCIGYSEHEDSQAIYSHQELVEVWSELTGEVVNLDYLKGKYIYDHQLEKAVKKFKEFAELGGLDFMKISDFYRSMTDLKMVDTIYKKDILDGKLVKDFREFKAFESSMYSCNRFYFPAMNGEQSGNSEASKMLLDVSTKIIEQRIKEIEEF